MWILPKTVAPLMSWSSAQATLASISDLNEQSQICASSLLVRSKPSPVRTWLRKWKRDSWTQHLSGRILRPSLAERFAAKWTSLLADTPASPSAPQESDWERKILDTFGPISANRSSSCDQGSASLRTSTGTFLWDCEKFSQTFAPSDTEWKRIVASQRGEYSQRVKSAPRTSANGSSSWPTISVNESKNSEMGSQAASSSPPLGTAAHLFGPPDQESGSTAGSLREPAEASAWPTISSNATTGGHTGMAGGSGTRASLEKMLGREEALKLNAKLNPRWVETLMGLPIGWTQPSCTTPLTIELTSYACSATGSCRQQRSGLSESCGGGSQASAWLTPRAVEVESDPRFVERMGDRSEGCFASLSHQVASTKDWPTIRASDAEHGGPNQRGSKGDLMLPAAVLRPGWGAEDLLEGL